ncbi:MAG: protein ral secretion pathway protein [Candidatus Parcubacteria bacterium]|jgi:general secretion pathway protein G
MKNTKKGFTLIELLVVIAIIGILSSVVLASLNNARRKSRDARRMADLQQIKLAAELYFDVASSYPEALADLVPDQIGTEPLDPLTGTSYEYEAYESDGSTAETGESVVDYCLGADIEDPATASSTASDGDCQTALGVDYAVAP